MRKFSNSRLLSRNRKIGSYGSLGGMLILVLGFVVSLIDPERYLTLSYVTLLGGFVLVNVGTYFTSRWGRTPAPDEAVNHLLKGLDDNYAIVHYYLGAEHALFTPNGIWAIVSKYEHGAISFDGKKWRQTGVSGFSKLFGAESVGDPVLDAEAEARSLSKKLKKILNADVLVRPMVVFLNEKTTVHVEKSPLPVLHAGKFKEFIRHAPKGPNITPDQLRMVLEYLGEKP